MEVLFVDSNWDKDVMLSIDALNFFKEKKVSSVALFASIQFSIKNIKKQLTSLGIKVNTTKAKRTSKEIQILGCDTYSDSFAKPIIRNSDMVLYVGDGYFHPKAILLSQVGEKIQKDVFIWNPLLMKLTILKKEEIKKQVQRRQRNLRMFLNSKTVGILVTLKPGQQYLKEAINLKNSLVSQNKKVYIFIGNDLDPNHLQNYPFIESWVNTACPRIGLDDIINIPEPIINLKDAKDPIKELSLLEGSLK